MKALALLFTLLTISTSALADELRGRVVSVSDGDTLTILDANNKQHKIRLNGIDAPEAQQDFGQAAKKHLSDLVFGKDVVVSWSKVDRYGRIVGTVTVNGTSANLEQLRAGFAWYYHHYASDVPAEHRAIYEKAEAVARAAKRGLWSQPNPQPPWEFRRGNAPAASSPVVTSSGQIIGNRNSKIFHAPGCPDYNHVSERNRVLFGSEAEAAGAGYRRARNCP
jgi:endonuclease YncB( thermonuclease family)